MDDHDQEHSISDVKYAETSDEIGRDCIGEPNTQDKDGASHVPVKIADIQTFVIGEIAFGDL